jgi:hypothetical protein
MKKADPVQLDRAAMAIKSLLGDKPLKFEPIDPEECTRLLAIPRSRKVSEFYAQLSAIEIGSGVRVTFGTLLSLKSRTRNFEKKSGTKFSVIESDGSIAIIRTA